MLRAQEEAPPKTPSRSGATWRHPGGEGDRTPRRTPHRTPTRTPHRYPGTPTRPLTRTPVRQPDFMSLAHHTDHHHAASATEGLDSTFFAYNPEKEPIKAYLRIRPEPPNYEADTVEPYLQLSDSLEVTMIPPENSNAYRTRNRGPERYKFTKIFTDSVTQPEFFEKTTLPLIKDVLNGENALIFAYGVTNSGKTYSIMGTKVDTGLLPRTLDVIFNSTKGYLSETKLKPVMHSLVQPYEDVTEENKSVLDNSGTYETPYPGGSNPDLTGKFEPPKHCDQTVIDIEHKFEYGIWVSFAEIYTEKIYDLLVPPDKQLKRKALSLKYEFRSGHKYIAGLREVRVQSIEEAYSILYQGQRNRAVFSTLMNHTSSRSHSIFTIRIVRVPIDEENFVIEDPSYATVSKMSIVDLAGSERYRNTLNSGQRLKEAGNINKSLMVLGQCMETLRLNQLKAHMGKRQAVVPFRHSKLTELFKSSFEGDGKAVMVVNVNPFDTGFDENSHVMKFAAVAKDVATWRRIHPKLDLRGISTSAKRPRTHAREKQALDADAGYSCFDDHDTALSTDDDDDGEAEDPFVDNLISQMEDLRDKWIDAETRCATMESSVRQQVSKEMESELRKMENIYVSNLKRENDVNESRINEQIETFKGRSGSEEHTSDDAFLVNLYDRQQSLTAEMDKLRAMVQDHDATKQNLLDKIAKAEVEKHQGQEKMRQLIQDMQERDRTIQKLVSQKTRASADQTEEGSLVRRPSQQHGLEQRRPSVSEERRSMPKDVSMLEDPFHGEAIQSPRYGNKFEWFLDLRKRLRRSVFRGEEYTQDADVIMGEIERFEGITFELVKETNMGKLMKLIAQKEMKNDPCRVRLRAKRLFKKYADLLIPVLTPGKRPRDSLIMLSVDAGKEEELISEMRDALDTLREENLKLKSRLKVMQDGQKRLRDAFEKTRDVDHDRVTINDLTLPAQAAGTASDKMSADEGGGTSMLSPVLGSSALTSSDEEEENDGETSDAFTTGTGVSDPSEIGQRRPKRRRKLRKRQTED